MSESNSESVNSCIPIVPDDSYPTGLLVTLSDTTVSTCLAAYVVTVELAPSVGCVPTASSLFVSVAVPIAVSYTHLTLPTNREV